MKDNLSSTRAPLSGEDTDTKRNTTILESQNHPFTTLDFRKTLNQDLNSLSQRHKKARVLSAGTQKNETPKSPISIKAPRRNGPDIENLSKTVINSDQRLSSPLDYEELIRKNTRKYQINTLIKEF